MSSAYRREDEVSVFARSGPGGIPGRVGELLGSGTVILHEVVDGRLVSLGTEATAWNPSEAAIDAGRWLLLVKLVGQWVVERVED